jgi:hypothetical protein
VEHPSTRLPPEIKEIPVNATEATAAAQEQTLSAVRATQETIVTFLKPFAALAEPIFGAASGLPFADRLPSPTSAVEQWYGFAADALAAQKEFSLSLVGLLPAGSTPAPAPKAPTKAA